MIASKFFKRKNGRKIEILQNNSRTRKSNQIDCDRN